MIHQIVVIPILLQVVFEETLNHYIDIFLKISTLAEGKALSSCTPHTEAWVTDIVFAKNSKQLVTVGNNIQVGFVLLYY